MKTLTALLLLVAAASAGDALELLRDALTKLEALDKQGAENSLSAAIEIEPRLAKAYLARGRLRAHGDRYEEAARDLECASRLGEDQWRRAAALYAIASAHDEAAHAYAQSWKVTGEIGDLIGLADARASAGKVESALLAYDEIVRRSSDMKAVEHLVERARLKSAIGRHEAGIKDVDLALRRIPRYSRAYRVRGRIRIRQGRTEEGLANYKTATAQETADPVAHWIFGLAQYDTGDWGGAARSFERAIAVQRDVHDYAHLYLFLARCRTGDPAKRMQASRELMKFLENRKRRDDWFGNLGAFLTGELEASELLAAARKGNKHTQREHLCEAHAYIAGKALIAGQEPTARMHFRKARETRVVSFVEFNTAEAELTRMVTGWVKPDESDAPK